MSDITLKFKKLDVRARTPRYATAGAGAFDLSSIDSGEVPPTFAVSFRTGLSFEIPSGFTMLVFSRSGHGFKNGVRLSNGVGVVDSDFRGEVCVKLHNDGDKPFVVEAGDRIAQAVLVSTPQVQLLEVAELSDTERGAGGFGSTGSQ